MPDEVKEEEQKKPEELDGGRLENVAGGSQNALPDRRVLSKVKEYIGETEKNLKA